MINLVTRLFDWLRRSWLWTLFEPVVLLVAIYGIAVSGYWQYLQWRYDGAVTLELFWQSHLLLRFTIIFWAVVLAFAVVLYGTFRTGVADPVVRRRRLTWKAVSGGVILLAIPLAAHVLSPRDDAGPIRVMLTAADEFAPPDDSLATAGSGAGNVDLRRLDDALLYLLFEINRRQTAWSFELETVRFRRDLIGDEVEAACRGDFPLLCLAEAYQARRREEGDRAAQVLITDVPLAPDQPGVRFWLQREAVSVITTWDWRWIEQPGIYEYLTYTLILQALMIHIDTGCGEPGFQADRGRGVVSGNVFENQPREPGVIAAVLAGHLGTGDRLLLLDCFGPAYLHRALELISLDWLRTDPVRDNLRRVYGVALPDDG